MTDAHVTQSVGWSLWRGVRCAPAHRFFWLDSDAIEYDDDDDELPPLEDTDKFKQDEVITTLKGHRGLSRDLMDAPNLSKLTRPLPSGMKSKTLGFRNCLPSVG